MWCARQFLSDPIKFNCLELLPFSLLWYKFPCHGDIWCSPTLGIVNSMLTSNIFKTRLRRKSYNKIISNTGKSVSKPGKQIQNFIMKNSLMIEISWKEMPSTKLDYA